MESQVQCVFVMKKKYDGCVPPTPKCLRVAPKRVNFPGCGNGCSQCIQQCRACVLLSVNCVPHGDRAEPQAPDSTLLHSTEHWNLILKCLKQKSKQVC